MSYQEESEAAWTKIIAALKLIQNTGGCECCDKDVSEDESRIVACNDKVMCLRCYEELLPQHQESFTEGGW